MSHEIIKLLDGKQYMSPGGLGSFYGHCSHNQNYLGGLVDDNRNTGGIREGGSLRFRALSCQAAGYNAYWRPNLFK